VSSVLQEFKWRVWCGFLETEKVRALSVEECWSTGSCLNNVEQCNAAINAALTRRYVKCKNHFATFSITSWMSELQVFLLSRFFQMKITAHLEHGTFPSPPQNFSCQTHVHQTRLHNSTSPATATKNQGRHKNLPHPNKKPSPHNRMIKQHIVPCSCCFSTE